METQRAKKKKIKISDDESTSNVNPEPIPLDLIPDILKRLPVKALARFLCVSKQFPSIIRNRDFMKSYLLKSSNRQERLIFTFDIEPHLKHFFFSSIQPQNRGESSSSSTAIYHMKSNNDPHKSVAPSVHGLICHGPSYKLKVYNPSTRRSITLPKLYFERTPIPMYYLGYDPVDGDYKVLCMTKGLNFAWRRGLARSLRLLTMGNGNSWRTIEDFPPHAPQSLDICIDGVLYYEAYLDTFPAAVNKHRAVMSFDVRSENFHLIKAPETAMFTKLTSYEGKLAIMCSEFTELSTCRIEMWILVDASKHEWLKKDFVFRCWNTESSFQVFCVTNAGEFVLAPEILSRESPFYVLYYDPNKKAVSRVFIEGITELKVSPWDKGNFTRRTISIFPGQVENLMFL